MAPRAIVFGAAYAVTIIDGNVDEPVRPLADVAYPAVSHHQRRSLHPSGLQAFVADQGQTGDLLASQPSDEEATPPLREAVARVEQQSGGGDGGGPELNRLLHPCAVCARVQRRAAVVHAIADYRPSVVAARQEQVELGAALRPVLGFPDVPGRLVDEEPLGAAVPVAPDLRPHTGVPVGGFTLELPDNGGPGDAFTSARSQGAGSGRAVLRTAWPATPVSAST